MTAKPTATGTAESTTPADPDTSGETIETPVAAGAARSADSAPLTEAEQEAIRQADARDRSPRAAGPNTKGKRVRYIAYGGGTHAHVRREDFKRFGLNHADVHFNFRNNVFTAPVGNGRENTLTQEAADLLTSQFPTMFEYMSHDN